MGPPSGVVPSRLTTRAARQRRPPEDTVMTTPPPALPPELNPRGPARRQRLRARTTAGTGSAPRPAPMRPGGRRRRWITGVTGALAAAVLGFSVIGSGL